MGHEFVEILTQPRGVVEISSSDDELVQVDPDIGIAPEVPHGRSHLTLWDLFIATFELATRWLL
jgi:hypothetical protein